MPVHPWPRGGAAQPLRVLLIDDHEISRVACGALLRTEGVDVAGDLPLVDATAEAVLRLGADVVIIDVTPGSEAPFGLARQLQAVPDGPAIVLTSSADPSLLAQRFGGMAFIAKADLSAGQLRAYARLAPRVLRRDCRQTDADHLQTP